MQSIKYCKKCLATNTRPGESFIDSICLGCRLSINNSKYSKRLTILKKSLIEKKIYNSKNAILGVSGKEIFLSRGRPGGKDSTRQALWLRDVLKINPLLVSLNYPPGQVNERGCRNLSNLIEKGFETLTISLSPQSWKKLMLYGFSNFGNWAKSTEQALYSCVPRIAINLNKPLIFNGEDPGLREESVHDKNDGWSNNSLRNLNTLKNNQWIFEIIEKYNTSSYFYHYPSESEFNKANLTVVDLGWVMQNWTYSYNGTSALLSGLECRKNAEIIDGDLSLFSALDEDFVAINQMMKYFKFGYSKTTDFINEEIRLGKISREESIPIVKKYDGICSDKTIEKFCKYLEIDNNYFWEILYKFTNKSLFKITDKKRPIPLFKIGKL